MLFHMIDGQNKCDQITSKRKWKCVLIRLPFVHSIYSWWKFKWSWLHTRHTCIIAIWTLELRAQLSLNRQLYKSDTSVKRTPRVGPFLSFLPLFWLSIRWTSLFDRQLLLVSKVSILERVDCIIICLMNDKVKSLMNYINLFQLLTASRHQVKNKTAR